VRHRVNPPSQVLGSSASLGRLPVALHPVYFSRTSESTMNRKTAIFSLHRIRILETRNSPFQSPVFNILESGIRFS
jgi:hypothetical protein